MPGTGAAPHHRAKPADAGIHPILSAPAPERELHGLTNLCARGGYVLAEAQGPRQVTLVATGHEAIMALAARKLLKEAGIAAAVVSLPCWELFAAQK
ncbi:transketolase C-terminal domain-containing protein [Komagataeibacter rhaeticus]|nr:transketolase C-terminal domain-containing protein [Komagataeibacter rhaeticus]